MGIAPDLTADESFVQNRKIKNTPEPETKLPVEVRMAAVVEHPNSANI